MGSKSQLFADLPTTSGPRPAWPLGGLTNASKSSPHPMVHAALFGLAVAGLPPLAFLLAISMPCHNYFLTDSSLQTSLPERQHASSVVRDMGEAILQGVFPGGEQ